MVKSNRILILFSLLYLLNITLFAQIKPYTLSIPKESAIIVPSVLMLSTAYIIGKNKPPIIETYINTLNVNSISGFDRTATSQFHKDFNTLSNITAYGTMLLPVLHLLNKNTRSDFKNLSVIYAETFLLNTGVTMLTKEWVSRDRPYLYNSAVPLSEKLNKDAQRSFFSGHTSLAASNSFFFATTFSHYYPNSKLKPWIWSACAVLPAITAYSRVKAGKHFPTDVIVGYVLGAAVGVSIPLLHFKNN